MPTVDLRGNLHSHFPKEVSTQNQEDEKSQYRFLLVEAKALSHNELVMAPAIETTPIDTESKEYHWGLLQPLSWLFAIGVGTWGRNQDEPLGNDDEEDMRTEKAFSLFEAKTFDHNLSERIVSPGGELDNIPPNDATILQKALERGFSSNDLGRYGFILLLLRLT